MSGEMVADSFEMWKISPTYISLNGSRLQSTKYGCSFIKNNKIELSVHREMGLGVTQNAIWERGKTWKGEWRLFLWSVNFFHRILLYVIYIIKIILKNKCVRGEFMFNVLFSDSIPRLKVRDLNSQWDSTQFHEIHSQEKGAKWSWWSLVILFFFFWWFFCKKLCVPRRCFIDDSWSASHFPSTFSSLLRLSMSSPCCFPLLYKATVLYHCQFVTFTTAADRTLMGGQFSFLSVILPAKPLG